MESSSSSNSMFQGASPKLTFVFGLIAGVAATSLLVMAFSYFKPGTASPKTANNTTTTTTNTGSGEPSFGDVAPVSNSDYVRGASNAKVTLIEYSDYECPFCKSFHPTMQRIMDEYSDDVAWVYRHFPLSFHNPGAQKQAEGALCVGKLGGADAYWEFTDAIFERTTSNGNGFPLENLGPLASEVGVNQGQFQKCLDGGEMATRVSTETSDGSAAGATGTPTTFIVGPDGATIDAIPGALPYEQIKTTLDAILATL